MSKDKYIKESDLFNAMENNSHMVQVFGTKRKMIDGILLTYDIAEFERLNIEEIRAKAIDEFAERIIEVYSYLPASIIKTLAEQLKGGAE